MLLKRQDHRISIIGALILLTLTLAAGISVYIVMQRQAESMLSKSLEVSLQSNLRLFESQIDQAMANTQAVTTRPFPIQNLQLLESEPDNATGLYELQRIAKSFLLTGFTGMSFYDVRGHEVAQAGRFSRNHDLRVPLKAKNHTSLLAHLLVVILSDFLPKNILKKWLVLFCSTRDTKPLTQKCPQHGKN